MVIQTNKIEVHWNYLLALERDLDEISRYVEFDERNFNCFSIEIARVLLASAAEVDVVCKQICKTLNPKSTADSINKYKHKILVTFPNIPQFQILLPRFGLTLTPWDEWKETTGVPFWWTAYNKIKHHRDSKYDRANLKNALNAVAGLFIMVLYLYKDKAERAELVPSPQLLRVDEYHGITALGRNGLKTEYNLS
ncbi:MAG: hypothetical protein PHW62_07845 [Candidatus Ratteibacteria bacterium]|nr:hypothetical protein [Candidatus Ratteibacteria bacterium]